MTTKQKTSLTLQVIRYDSYLNWLLGFALTFFPSRAESLLGQDISFPLVFWLALGLAFIGFAYYQQTQILSPNKLLEKHLIIMTWLAWIPVVALTYGLVLFTLPLYPTAHTLLWVGNIYMVLLGYWYLNLSQKLKS